MSYIGNAFDPGQLGQASKDTDEYESIDVEVAAVRKQLDDTRRGNMQYPP